MCDVNSTEKRKWLKNAQLDEPLPPAPPIHEPAWLIANDRRRGA